MIQSVPTPYESCVVIRTYIEWMYERLADKYKMLWTASYGISMHEWRGCDRGGIVNLDDCMLCIVDVS